MAIVLKGNRQLTIEEHKVEDYVAQGYDYIDKCGNVLTKAALKKEVKTKDSTLQEALNKVKTLESSVADKEAEIETLNAKIAEFEKNQSTSKNSKSASK